MQSRLEYNKNKQAYYTLRRSSVINILYISDTLCYVDYGHIHTQLEISLQSLHLQNYTKIVKD